MASLALQHKSGGYRAYKKIAGREFQFYSKDREEANRVQDKYESLASLSSKAPFSKCGRLLGFRFNLCLRAGKTPYISIRAQVGAFRNQSRLQWKYSGVFENDWKKMTQTWAELHGIHKVDLVSYFEELKTAKRIYIQDAGSFEEKLRRLKISTQ